MISGAIGVLSLVTGVVKSPMAKWVGIAVAGMVFIGYVRHDAAEDARADAAIECREQTQAKTKRELARQAKIAKGVLEDQYRRAANAEERAVDLKGKADALVAELKNAGRGCTLDPSTIERLQQLR